MDRNHDMELAQDLVDRAMQLVESTTGVSYAVKWNEASQLATVALAIFARWAD